LVCEARGFFFFFFFFFGVILLPFAVVSV